MPAPTVPQKPEDAALVARLAEVRAQLSSEFAKAVVGQTEAFEHLLLALLCRGHCLIEGVPGLAKTVMVQTLGRILDLSYSRVQFTPDLMPADITGSDIIQEDPETGRRQFEFLPGPVFAHLVLADEINRTPPKTQAALLEAMSERRVTCRGRTYELPDPFFVLATQNPIEQEGTYTLPEAQLDRFMFHIRVDYPDAGEEVEILRRTTGSDRPILKKLFKAQDLVLLQDIVRQVPVPERCFDYAVALVRATRPGHGEIPDATTWLQWGAGPRAGQMLILGAKARALLHGRFHVTTGDLAALARPVLRHRVVLSFAAQANGITAETVIGRIVEGIEA